MYCKFSDLMTRCIELYFKSIWLVYNYIIYSLGWTYGMWINKNCIEHDATFWVIYRQHIAIEFTCGNITFIYKHCKVRPQLSPLVQCISKMVMNTYMVVNVFSLGEVNKRKRMGTNNINEEIAWRKICLLFSS